VRRPVRACPQPGMRSERQNAPIAVTGGRNVGTVAAPPAAAGGRAVEVSTAGLGTMVASGTAAGAAVES
jgi:hypothetical protein